MYQSTDPTKISADIDEGDTVYVTLEGDWNCMEEHQVDEILFFDYQTAKGIWRALGEIFGGQ